MWSGIVALASQKAKHGLGWINPGIDKIAADANAPDFRDITEGNNGAYSAKVGWDPVTGWGSPGNGWELVQDMAAQSVSSIQSGLQIYGTVIGDVPIEFNQKIMNGTGTIDILGSGFGEAQGHSYVTLSLNGTSYTVPASDVQAWSDTDITLKIDSYGTFQGLFSESGHPNQPGTYQLAVHIVSQAGDETVSNPTNVTLADFLYITDSSGTNNQPTQVSGNDTVYQDVTIDARTPDGSVTDASLQDMTISFFVFPASVFGDTTGFVVQQNGQPCQKNPDGSFQVVLSGGKATVQVASHIPGTFEYDASGPNLYGYDDSAKFALKSQSGTHLVNRVQPGYNFTPSGRDNLVSVALEDENGNIATEADHIQITLTPDPNNQYPAGPITVDDTKLLPPSPSSPSTPDDYTAYVTTLLGDGDFPTMLNVSDTVAEPVTLTIQDLDNSAIAPIQIPLFFTAAHTLQLTATDGSNGVPVSVDGQAANWQDLQLNVLDENGNKTAYAGNGYFAVLGSQDYLSDVPPAYQVEASYDGGTTWEPLQANDANEYPIQLSKLGDSNQYTLKLRVASPVAESVTYRAVMITSTADVDAEEIGQFTAGTLDTLFAQPMLPHMATSSMKNPQYVAVSVAATNANGNSVAANDTKNDTIVLSEGFPCSLYSVAVAGKNGKLQALSSFGGTWKFKLSQLIDHQIYIASAQPGETIFDLSDATRSNVKTTSFTLDFVNSMVSGLKVPTLNPAAAGEGVQTVEVDLADQNWQTVINSNDFVGLSFTKKPKGNVVVKGVNGELLDTDDSGRYVVMADAGVAKFYITDSVVENLSYTFTDLSESKVQGTTSTGSFVVPSKIVMTPIATSVLGIDQPASVKLTAYDGKGHALGRAKVFLSFWQTAGGGQAVVDIDPNHTPLDKTPREYTTDDSGQLTITYTTPDVLPNGGTDTIIAQETDYNPHAKATDSYQFASAVKYVWGGDGKTIAKTGTLPAGQPTTVKVTAYDSKKQVLPHTTVFLAINTTAIGGTATVQGQVPLLSGNLTQYVTDGNGQITITYNTPQQLPGNETDVITAQDTVKYPHVKSSVSYTYSPIGKLIFSPTTLGATGSLLPGASVPLKLSVQDAAGKAMPNTIVFLSLNLNAKVPDASTAVVAPSNAIDDQTAVTNQPLPFVTDAEGNIQITYTVPDPLPNGGMDTLIAQDAVGLAKKKVTLSYTFLRSTQLFSVR